MIAPKINREKKMLTATMNSTSLSTCIAICDASCGNSRNDVSTSTPHVRFGIHPFTPEHRYHETAQTQHHQNAADFEQMGDCQSIFPGGWVVAEAVKQNRIRQPARLTIVGCRQRYAKVFWRVI